MVLLEENKHDSGKAEQSIADGITNYTQVAITHNALTQLLEHLHHATSTALLQDCPNLVQTRRKPILDILNIPRPL